LYLIYMSTGAYDIARSYVDKYIIIWNAGVIIALNLCYCVSVVMPGYLCTINLQHLKYNIWRFDNVDGWIDFYYSVVPALSVVICIVDCSIFMCCDNKGS
jgi:hypothetical protein